MSDATSADSLDRPGVIKPEEGGSPTTPPVGVVRRNVLGLWTAGRFLLLPGDPPVDDPAIWRTAARWLVPVGLCIGLAWTSWFSLLWWKFGEIERIRVVPAMGVVLLDVTFLGYKFFRATILSLQALIEKHRAARGASVAPPSLENLPVMIGVVVLLMLKFALIVSIPTTHQWWPSDWRQNFLWMYPPTVYRPLVLAPIWGAWGVLLAVSIGRVSSSTDSAVQHLGRVVRPGLILGWFLVLAVITAVYCSHHRDTEVVGVILSLGVFGVTFLSSALLAHRLGGQSEYTVFTAGQLAQLSFITAFLAFGPYVFG